MIQRTLNRALMFVLMLAMLPVQQMARAEYDMPYYIEVDIKNQITTVYRTSDDAVVYQAICTTGTDEFYTPSGTFYLPKPTDTEREEWFYFRMYGTYAKYATRIYKGVLFHSVLYSRKDDSTLSQKSVTELGTKASHGCIRLRVPDAKWIAEHCEEGTRVHIFRNGKRDEELRELLLAESYDGEAGINGRTYAQYLGMAEDENSLGRYSEGPAVLDLQYRLLSLGFFTGEITGVYTAATVKAVRAFQTALGVEETGVASVDMLEKIYADDAPVGSLVSLVTGMSGPVVAQLQRALSDLRFYEGDLDSVYDAEVEDAVHAFQGAFGYDYDDACLPEVQLAALNASKQLRDVFGGGNYQSEMKTREYEAALISSDVSVRLRKTASTAAGYLEKLESGARVLVLERLDGGWSHVQSGLNDGYIKDEYLSFYTYTNTIVTYTSMEGNVQIALGQTLEEYLMGNVEAAAEATLELVDAEFVRVNTGSADVRLNLRQEPRDDSIVIAKLSDGLELEAMEVGDEWTKVEYEGFEGYLLNQYLTTETRQVLREVMPEEDEDDYLETIYAVVNTASDSTTLNLRQYDSPDSEVLAQLSNGERVEVISADEDWSYVRYGEQKGYLLNQYLQFELVGEEGQKEEE